VFGSGMPQVVIGINRLAELRSAWPGQRPGPTQALIKLLLFMQLPNLTEGFQKA